MFRIFLAALTVFVFSSQFANAQAHVRKTHHTVVRHHQPGHFVTKLPVNRKRVVIRGQNYFFDSGIFYVSRTKGFIVIAAPIGAQVRTLPSGRITFVIGGKRYYHFGNTYYVKHKKHYIVVAKPAGAGQFVGAHH